MPISNGFNPLKIHIGAVDEKTSRKLVFGRSKLVQAFWQRLEASSIRVLAERRMGKTWVLNLALALRPESVAGGIFDAQSCHSAPEFVWQLNKALHQSGLTPDKWWTKAEGWFRRTYQRLQGQSVGPLTVPELDPWTSLLEDTCRHFAEHNKERKAVLMIDELPFFLDKLIKVGRSQEAIQFLDTFRALRQALPSFRVVLCGSLGLHIVLAKLQETGYSGRPVNDMPPFEVPPLDPDDAWRLAGGLLVGEQIPCSDEDAVARTVAEASSGVPFYIQHIVSWMVQRKEQPWTPERAREVPEELFNAAGDPAEFSYYNGRLDQYYPEDWVEKARAVLDVLSRKPEGLLFDELVNLVRHRPKTLTVDAEQILAAMHTLQDDHYVVRNDDDWRFKLEIVRRWWFGARGRLAL